MPISEADVLGYQGLIEQLATILSRTPAARRVGAEYDDLVQVGYLTVIERHSKGVWPVAAESIRRGMNDHMRDLRAQIALGPRRVEPGDEHPWGLDGQIIGFDEEQHSA